MESGFLRRREQQSLDDQGTEVKRIVGFTTTIPVEIVFAAGLVPCDLNNIFISDRSPIQYIERAEKDGFLRGS